MPEYLSPAVYVEELSSGIKPIQGVGTSTAGFVGLAGRGPIGEAVAVSNFAEFVRTFGSYYDEGYLAYAVKAFFDEGGTSCYVVRTCHYTGLVPDAAVAFHDFPTAAGTIRITASSPGEWGRNLVLTISDGSAADTFNITVLLSGVEVERLEELSVDSASARYVVDVLPQESRYLLTSGAAQRPTAVAGQALASGGGDGLTDLAASDFCGEVTVGLNTVRKGLKVFDAVDDVNILAVPDAVHRDVHVKGLAYCQGRGDCFYLADPLEKGVETAGEVLSYKLALGPYAGGNALNSTYGALYTPWISVFDPVTGGERMIPPCGAVAGRYAGTDGKRGVHKAAAGTIDGRLGSVLGLEVDYTTADQEKLNPRGINVIRRFDGVGNVIWGARTVSTDPEWRYLNVRRLFLFLEESIAEATTWAVFEPNGPELWKSIVRNVAAFLRLQWRSGALVGVTEEQAFYVKCDEETNPQEVIDAGQVVTEIGVAPSKPAEFVIFRIRQFAAGSEVTE